MTASCATCPFRFPVADLLQCIARPPAAEPVTGVAVWPRVKPTDVCADHPDFVPLPAPAVQSSLKL